MYEILIDILASETAGLLPARYFVRAQKQSGSGWDVRENLFRKNRSSDRRRGSKNFEDEDDFYDEDDRAANDVEDGMQADQPAQE